MKKSYETPSVEIVKFQYSEQIVAKSGCRWEYRLNGDDCAETPVRVTY